MHGAGRRVMLRVGSRDKPVHTMTSLDATICLDQAHAADPFRGVRYLEAFWDKAEELGYWDAGVVACGDCPHKETPGCEACPAECGYVRGDQHSGPGVPIHPVDESHPADGFTR